MFEPGDKARITVDLEDSEETPDGTSSVCKFKVGQIVKILPLHFEGVTNIETRRHVASYSIQGTDQNGNSRPVIVGADCLASATLS